MSNIYDMTDTWNNGATVFTAMKMNVTDTASDSASLLCDLQVGGVSKFNVTKSGYAYMNRIDAATSIFTIYDSTLSDCVSFGAYNVGPGFALSLIHISEPTRPY